jgi:hypothetical protein
MTVIEGVQVADPVARRFDPALEQWPLQSGVGRLHLDSR